MNAAAIHFKSDVPVWLAPARSLRNWQTDTGGV
jgi:hypothetical protein